MIIESTNLSPLASINSVTVDNISPPLVDGVVSEGFSGALVAQIELLNNIKTDTSASLPVLDINPAQENNSSQGSVAGLPPSSDMQDFAALLGNDLPMSYKTADDVDHEAALAAVTDTLKYIAADKTAEEKAAVFEQNMKDVIAMAIPAKQDVLSETILAAPVGQNMPDVVATAVPAKQDVLSEPSAAAPVGQDMANAGGAPVLPEQNMKNVVAMPASTVQNTLNTVSESGQNPKDVTVEAPVQKELEQRGDEADKKPVEDQAQDNSGNNGLLAAVASIIVPPPVRQPEQAKPVSNLTSEEAIKDDGLTPLVGGGKQSNQPVKVLDNIAPAETVFRQQVKDKQGFNSNLLQDSVPTEKAGRVDQQISSFEGEKILTRAGADIAPSSRSIDNKTDIPAMTKPLSHPEWNKDLGDRIVWMSSKAIPSAEIRLNPQHLGPISVRVDVADDQATVVFTAQHASVRETIEASIPKLREMMGAQQLNLADVSVSQGSASDQGRSQSQNFAQTADGRGQRAMIVDDIDDVEQEVASGRAVVSNGLLSIYA
ncbi:MAG: flagellar hook-length control protein FliK [Methylobacter sp.]